MKWVNGRHNSACGSGKLFELIEEFAAREKRKLGNLAELILEWVFEQLKTAGSTQDLLKYGIRRHESRTKRNEENRTIAT